MSKVKSSDRSGKIKCCKCPYAGEFKPNRQTAEHFVRPYSCPTCGHELCLRCRQMEAVKSSGVKRLQCRPTKFQRGDIVLTPTGKGVVTAVGLQCESPVFRVGPRIYWYGWQLPLHARNVQLDWVIQSPGEERSKRVDDDVIDRLSDLAYSNSRKTGENPAEELMQLLLQSGLAVEVPTEGDEESEG
jgi:hypothetical protein